MPFCHWSSQPPGRPNQLIVGPLADAISCSSAGFRATTISWLLSGLHSVRISCSLALHCSLVAASNGLQDSPPTSHLLCWGPSPRYGKPRSGVWQAAPLYQGHTCKTVSTCITLAGHYAQPPISLPGLWGCPLWNLCIGCAALIFLLTTQRPPLMGILSIVSGSASPMYLEIAIKYHFWLSLS